MYTYGQTARDRTMKKNHKGCNNTHIYILLTLKEQKKNKTTEEGWHKLYGFFVYGSCNLQSTTIRHILSTYLVAPVVRH